MASTLQQQLTQREAELAAAAAEAAALQQQVRAGRASRVAMGGWLSCSGCSPLPAPTVPAPFIASLLHHRHACLPAAPAGVCQRGALPGAAGGRRCPRAGRGLPGGAAGAWADLGRRSRGLLGTWQSACCSRAWHLPYAPSPGGCHLLAALLSVHATLSCLCCRRWIWTWPRRRWSSSSRSWRMPKWAAWLAAWLAALHLGTHSRCIPLPVQAP